MANFIPPANGASLGSYLDFSTKISQTNNFSPFYFASLEIIHTGWEVTPSLVVLWQIFANFAYHWKARLAILPCYRGSSKQPVSIEV